MPLCYDDWREVSDLPCICPAPDRPPVRMQQRSREAVEVFEQEERSTAADRRSQLRGA